jgi:carbamoyl-phosphate synthase large subunit
MAAPDVGEGRSAGAAGHVRSGGPPGPTGPAVLLTGVGKRYDIVSAFARHATVIAADPNPLAPAQYAAHHRRVVPRIDDPAYVPTLQSLCEELRVGAVVPLTDLDIEVLARARADGKLPAFVPDPEIARATYDKYEAHRLLERLGLPSPPTVLPGEPISSYPVMVKPRQGSGARSIHRADDAQAAAFFVDYVDEPTMIQQFMAGPEFSIDCLSDLRGRCLNAIPRTMIESRGGESIKGTVIADRELIELGRQVVEALGVRGPCTVQVFRDNDTGLGITDVNTRFGGAFPAPMYAALPGRTYPELIVLMARGEAIEPHVGAFRAGITFTRYFWQMELNEQLQPTGRDIVDPPGPPPPR